MKTREGNLNSLEKTPLQNSLPLLPDSFFFGFFKSPKLVRRSPLILSNHSNPNIFQLQGKVTTILLGEGEQELPGEVFRF